DLSDGSFFRNVTEAPGELPGWVTVSATGYHNDKAWYSNYGESIDVSAPGGSTRDYTGTPGVVDCGPHTIHLCRLVGAWSSTATAAPNEKIEQCTTGNTPVCAEYGWVQGTSMATPSVAGPGELTITEHRDLISAGRQKPVMSLTT